MIRNDPLGSHARARVPQKLLIAVREESHERTPKPPARFLETTKMSEARTAISLTDYFIPEKLRTGHDRAGVSGHMRGTSRSGHDLLRRLCKLRRDPVGHDLFVLVDLIGLITLIGAWAAFYEVNRTRSLAQSNSA
jgi:hypothetical protein